MGKQSKPTSAKNSFLTRKLKSFRSKVRKLTKTVVVLIVLGVTSSIAATVYAISATSPDPPQQGNFAMLAIGRIARGSTLPSPETSVKLIYGNNPGSVDVFDGAWCGASNYDRRAAIAVNPCSTPDLRSNVVFEFQAIDNDSNAILGAPLTVLGSTMAAGGGVNGNYRVNLAGLAGLARSTDNKFFIKVSVFWQYPNQASCTDQIVPDATCPGGTNFFRFSIPNATANDRITYAVTNGDPSPLSVEAAGPGVPQFSNMSFEFAPPCGATDAQRRQPLKWEDADFGETNQASPISWDLYDETQGGPPVLSQSNAQLGTQGEQVTYPNGGFQFLDGHKYRWTWNHVEESNGVQLYFPFDSYNYIRRCATVTVGKSNNARPNQAIGEPFAYFLTIRHSGPFMSSLSINDVLPNEIQYIPDGAFNQPAISGQSGQTLNWTFNAGSQEINTLNSTGELVIQFRVQGTTNGTFTNRVGGSGVDVNGATVTVPNTTNNVTIRTIDLTNKPYFSVRGGDARAGAGMDLNGNSCTTGGLAPNANGSIVSWNMGAPNYNGAGGQYGTFALNHLQGFPSGQGSTTAPAGVSFANVGGSSDQFDAARQLYGGELGSMDCMPDYLENATGGLTGDRRLSTLLGVAVGGTYNVPNGSTRTIYLSRDNLLIDANVQFSGNYATTAAIPSFSVLVRGNVFIDPNVRRLDGFYVAQPSNAAATNGIIYTCAPSGFSTTAANILTRTLSTRCNLPLTFNGAVAARQVWLLRTSGSLQANTAAETFNYWPETWLNAPTNGGLNPPSSDGYDSITSLPPIL